MAIIMSERKNHVLFHVLCLLINLIGCAYEWAYIRLPIFETYGGRFKFLTHWTQYLHLCYFGYAVIVEVYMSLFKNQRNAGRENQSNNADKAIAKSKPHIFRQVGDLIFVSVCFPLGVMVCVLFWIITLKDPDGLSSKETQKVVPLSSPYNHYLHTFPLLLNSIGIWMVPFVYPKRLYGLTIDAFFAVAYISWLVHVGNHTGFWCYPFIEHQSMPEFIAFVLVSMIASLSVYITGEKLSTLLWKKDVNKDL